MGMVFQSTLSAGGIPVVVSEMTQVESVCVGLWFPVGSRHEAARLSGALHFIEHLFFKGTKRRTARQISEAVEGVGGYLNAFTSEEMTCYHAAAPASRLALLFDVLLDMVDGSLFAPEEVERERGVILEEIKMYDDQPSQLVQERLNALLWPGSALGRPITGTRASVSRLSRADLVGCRERYCAPSRMTVTVAGRTTLPEVLSHLGRRKGGGAAARFSLPASALFKPGGKAEAMASRVSALEKGIEQTHIALGFRGGSRHDPSRYAAKMLSVIVGENMSSRLFQRIRERHGLAYSIASQISYYHDTGSFSVLAGVENEKTERALGLILQTLAEIVAKPPSAAELRRARDYVVGQTYMGLESTSNQMMWAGEGMIGYGKVLTPREVEARIAAVTREEVQQVAASLFVPRNLAIASVGPGVTKEALAKLAASVPSR
ncbi:Predicted Zn-dependent peptidase [Verrucomicrobium sp. GAS474]|uniref:M16 family metallopeptidase n=1 Tax=Verrucomicrobium sp. GAS474 TaxID=1882831 RepID=UPI00087B421A|nr:pitrilysin family protein [Verrucomicrobium sp. GAS474]SDU22957.1 Predicted Zn-dependent peptidase [Verrucomicrobium sp. GAS474]